MKGKERKKATKKENDILYRMSTPD